MQWSNHCVHWQIDFVGVLFGLRPLLCVWFVFCLVCCFLWRNASLAGGFAGRRGLVVLCVFWLFYFDLPAHMDQLCPCTNVFSTAYAHVKTEPQSDIGQTRGKKIKYFFYRINRIPQPQFSCDRHEDSGHSKSDNGLKFYKVMRLEPNGPETECKQLVYCATLPGG